MNYSKAVIASLKTIPDDDFEMLVVKLLLALTDNQYIILLEKVLEESDHRFVKP